MDFLAIQQSPPLPELIQAQDIIDPSLGGECESAPLPLHPRPLRDF